MIAELSGKVVKSLTGQITRTEGLLYQGCCIKAYPGYNVGKVGSQQLPIGSQGQRVAGEKI